MLYLYATINTVIEKENAQEIEIESGIRVISEIKTAAITTEIVTETETVTETATEIENALETVIVIVAAVTMIATIDIDEKFPYFLTNSVSN